MNILHILPTPMSTIDVGILQHLCISEDAFFCLCILDRFRHVSYRFRTYVLGIIYNGSCKLTDKKLGGSLWQVQKNLFLAKF